MSEKRVRNLYEQLLLGEAPIRPYRNTNLVTVDSERKSIEERTAKNISPPINLNPKYNRSKEKKSKKSSSYVSDEVLKGFGSRK